LSKIWAPLVLARAEDRRCGDLYRDGRGTISPTMRVARELAQRAGFA
jgi:hypothetical protein